MISSSALRRTALILGMAFSLFNSFTTSHAQQSNGLTYYHIADSTSTDINGNVLTGAANSSLAFQTDGSTVVFLNRTGPNDGLEHCGSNWGLYTTPFTGGKITPLVTNTTKVEPSEPDGTSASICEQPLLIGGNVFYGADYTPAGGTRRYGFFSIPLMGGSSRDILATGDVPFLSNPAITTVYNGASITPTTTQPLSSAALLGTDTFFGEVASPSVEITSPPVTGSVLVSSSSGLPVGALGSIVTCSSSYPYFDHYIVSAETLTSSGTGSFAATVPLYETSSSTFSNRTGIIASSSPIAFGCQSVVLDPLQPDPTFGSGPLRLPGEPLPDMTGYPVPFNIVSTLSGQVAVSGTTIYFAAEQTYGSGKYWGIFALNDGVISKIWSNLDPIPGIDPTVAPCSPSTGNVSAYGLVAAGNYLLFWADQQVQNCTTMVSSHTGGIYVYDLTTKTITRAVAEQAVLVPGDQPYSGASVPVVGSLTPDGHFIFSSAHSRDSNNNLTSSTLYSTYLAQTVTAVSLFALSPLPFNGTVDLSAKVTPNTGQSANATGSVNFYDGSTLLGTQPINSTGLAIFKASITALGNHIVSAVYTGDPLYEGATSANSTITITISNTPTTLTLTASTAGSSIAAGTPLTFTAALTTQASGTPGGFISFADNGKILGFVSLSSADNAVFTISTLAVGAHSITASYAGDTSFLPSQSSAINITIGTPDYALAATPASVAITSGQSANITFTLTPSFGFSQVISLACTGLPANATCTFAPSTLTPTGAPVTSVLTIATGVKSASLTSPFRNLRTTAVVFAATLLLLPFAAPREQARTKLNRLALLLFVFALGMTLISINGCSAGSTSSTSAGTTTTTSTATPAGSYTVIIEATAGTTSHNAPIAVTIN